MVAARRAEQEIWKRYPFPQQEEERKVERARKERASSKKVCFDEGAMSDNEEFAGRWDVAALVSSFQVEQRNVS